MALQRAYQLHPDRADAYRAALGAKAGAFGFSQAEVAAVNRPVLVRQIGDVSPERARLLVHLLNESATQEQSPRAGMIAQARKLGDDVIQTLAVSMDPEKHPTFGAYLRSRASADLVEALRACGVLDRRNVSRYVDPGTGLLNEDGRVLVSRLLLGRYVPDLDLLEAVGIATRENLAGALPWILAAGAANATYDLTPHLGGALRAMVACRALGTGGLWRLRREHVLGSAEGRHEVFASPLASALLAVLIGRDGPRLMVQGFRRYATIAQDNNGPCLFGAAATTEAHRALALAFGLGDDPLATVEDEQERAHGRAQEGEQP